MRPERVCSFVVLLKNQRQEYEHTNSDVGNEKTESGVAEAVGSGAARVPPKVKITEWSAGGAVLRKQTIAKTRVRQQIASRPDRSGEYAGASGGPGDTT